MNWSKVGELVGKAAPLVGGLLGGPAGASVGGLVAGWLGSEPTPDAVMAKLEQDPAALERIRTKELENEAELTQLYFQTMQVQITETNQTMRVEAKSEDPYVRRARPGWLYAMKWVWGLQVAASLFLLLLVTLCASFVDGFSVADAVKLGNLVVEFSGATMPMWGIGLSVIGVYNVQRSKDKAAAAGQPPPTGLLDNLKAAIGRKP